MAIARTRTVIIEAIPEQRCVKCGQWLSPDTVGHGSLGNGMCNGQGMGRWRVQLWVNDNPFRLRGPTKEEREQHADLVAEARRTKRRATRKLEVAVTPKINHR